MNASRMQADLAMHSAGHSIFFQKTAIEGSTQNGPQEAAQKHHPEQAGTAVLTAFFLNSNRHPRHGSCKRSCNMKRFFKGPQSTSLSAGAKKSWPGSVLCLGGGVTMYWQATELEVVADSFVSVRELSQISGYHWQPSHPENVILNMPSRSCTTFIDFACISLCFGAS